MRRGRFTEEQRSGVLRAQEAGGTTADMCRRHGISPATFHKWKAQHGGLQVAEARRLRVPQAENARPWQLLADEIPDNAMPREVASREW